MFILKKREFRTINGELDNNVYYAIDQYNSNEILTSKGDIIINDQFSLLKEIEKINSSHNLVIDSDKSIWGVTLNTLRNFKFTKNGVEIIKEYDFDGIITIVKKINKNGLMMGIQNDNKTSGLIYFFNTKSENIYKKIEVSSVPMSLNLTKDSILWIGTKKELIKYNLLSNTQIKFSELKNSQVRDIFISDNTDVWVTTYTNGFFHIKNEVVTSFPLDKNKYLLSAHCIIEDDDNYFWISTNKGLFQVNKNCLLKYVTNNNYKFHYKYYDKKSGFNTNEFNGGGTPCGVKLDNSNIAFPSMDGIVIFNPKKIIKNSPINPLFIDNILIDEQSLKTSDTIYIEKVFDRLKIEYSTPFYDNLNNLYIDYKLERNNIAGNWFEIDDNLAVTFTNLKHGNYNITTRIKSDFEGEYLYTSFYIIVPKPFWLKWWFILLIIISSILFFLIIYKLRLNFLKKQNLELSKNVLERTNDLKSTIQQLNATHSKLSKQNRQYKKLLSSITHDIKSPLKYLSYTSKYLFENTDEKKTDLKEYSKSIYTSSQQIYLFIENLLEYSKLHASDSIENKNQYNLSEAVNKKINLFSNIAKSNNITIKNTINEKITININQHLLSVIIHNLLDNSIKYTKNGNITISASINNHKIEISIKDTGIGMKTELSNFYNNLAKQYNNLENTKSISKGLGLNMVIELISLIDGEIQFSSAENKGTGVKLIFDYTL